MHDCHLFHRITGRTVDEIISNWIAFNAQPHPAYVGDVYVKDLGPIDLGHATVMCGDKELRRVGQYLHWDWQRRNPKDEEAVIAYRQALLNDPDIPRLLTSGDNS
jgi:hypothetical protein